MSLAPTLQTFRDVSPGVGLVAIAGLTTALLNNVPSPSTGVLNVSGLQPTVIATAGPYAAPNVGYSRIVASAPALGITLVVYPQLPDTTSPEQDIPPTILLGSSSSAGIPGVGYVATGGLQPTLLRDNAAFAFIPAPNPIVAAGLVPVVSVPAGQDGTATPRLGTAQATELAPSILGELNVSAGLGGITITGLVPTLVYAAGWETVALSGAAVWTDVPRAS